MKISIIGAFNLADGYLGAAKALERLGHTICFVPAYKYKSENPEDHEQHIINDLNEKNADVCLWWRAETLNSQEFMKIRKNVKGKFALYSWDDPYQWEKHKEMPFKCKMLDVAFTCCESSIDEYKANGCDAHYCPPGFDPEIHYPDFDPEYECDVSIVCTNFYDGNQITKYKHMSRKVLLETLISNIPDLDIRIYGVEGFKDIFPDHYKGWIGFDESRKVFSSSKINICTHIRPDGYKYINERVTQILGSGGLLYVDNVNGIGKVLDIENECVIMDNQDKYSYIDQIKNILSNYKDYEKIRENGNKKALESFTWDNWAKTISENL